MLIGSLFSLVVISSGAYNHGNTSVIKEFTSELACEVFRLNLEDIGGMVKTKCIRNSPEGQVGLVTAQSLAEGDFAYIKNTWTRVHIISRIKNRVVVNRNITIPWDTYVEVYK